MAREQTDILCNPAKLPLFLETEHGSSKAKGQFGPWVNSYLTLVENIYNITIKFIAYPGFGDRVNNSDAFTGCFGQVQRGEADTIFALVDYPMDIVNVSQGHILFDDRIGYIGGYSRVKFQPYDFTGTFSAFDAPIWSTVIAFLVLFRIFIWIKLKLTVKYYSPEDKLVRRGDYTYRTITHFTGDGEIESNDHTMRVTYISLSVYSFLVFAVFCNLMNTGLVVSKPPLIFENYDDLIKYNIKPLFMDQMYDFHYFKYAHPGTEENNFWNWAVETFGEKEILHEPSPFSAVDIALQVAAQKRVFFSSTDIILPLRWTMCKLLARKLESIKSAAMTVLSGKVDSVKIEEGLKALPGQSYIRFGENMKWMSKQVVLSENSRFNGLFVNIATRVVEHGHIVYVRREMQKINMLEQIPGVEMLGKEDPSLRIVTENCLSSQPQDEERTADEMSVVTFFSLRFLVDVIIAFLLLAFFFLAFERFFFKSSRSMPCSLAKQSRSVRTWRGTRVSQNAGPRTPRRGN